MTAALIRRRTIIQLEVAEARGGETTHLPEFIAEIGSWTYIPEEAEGGEGREAEEERGGKNGWGIAIANNYASKATENSLWPLALNKMICL